MEIKGLIIKYNDEIEEIKDLIKQLSINIKKVKKYINKNKIVYITDTNI